jgi:hypothetical protein
MSLSAIGSGASAADAIMAASAAPQSRRFNRSRLDLEHEADDVILEQNVLTSLPISRPTELAGHELRPDRDRGGALSQWPVDALTAADLSMICVDTLHMKALRTARRTETVRAGSRR